MLQKRILQKLRVKPECRGGSAAPHRLTLRDRTAGATRSGP
jgi:hypothetical protein